MLAAAGTSTPSPSDCACSLVEEGASTWTKTGRVGSLLRVRPAGMVAGGGSKVPMRRGLPLFLFFLGLGVGAGVVIVVAANVAAVGEVMALRRS